MNRQSIFALLGFAAVVGMGPLSCGGGEGGGSGSGPLENLSFGTPELLNLTDGSLSLQSVVVLDFNGDQNLDLVSIDRDGMSSLAFFPGNGDGTFGSKEALNVGNVTVSYLTAADLNANGKQDLIFTRDDSKIAVLRDGDTSKIEDAALDVGSNPRGITVADFDGDQWLDIVVVSEQANDIRLFRGKTNGTALETPDIFKPMGLTGPTAVVAADFNGDGRIDLAIGNVDGAQNQILILKNVDNMGQVSFPDADVTTLDVGNNPPTSLAVGEFNDQDPDFAVSISDTPELDIFLGAADFNFDMPSKYSVGKAPSAIVVSDFNLDGNQDLAVAASGDVSIAVLLGKGDGLFEQIKTFSSTGTNVNNFTPYSVVVGDLNQDGKPDLVAHTSDGMQEALAILLNTSE